MKALWLRLAAIVLFVAGLLVGIAQSASATAAPRVARRNRPARSQSAPATAAHRPIGAVPAATRRPATDRVVCSETITLGQTRSCNFPFENGVEAEYTFASPGPDKIILSFALRDGAGGESWEASASMVDSTGAYICDFDGGYSNPCTLPDGGTYTVRVSAYAGPTVYTTLESVLQPSSCATDLDLTIAGPPTPVAVGAPGAFWCAHLPTATAGDLLQVAAPHSSYFGFGAAIFDGDGVRRCGIAVTYRMRSFCGLGGGSDFRLLMAPDYNTDAIVVDRWTDPDGCTAGSLDEFGAPPAHSGSVPAYSTRCSTFSVGAPGKLAVHVLSLTNGVGVKWSILSSDTSEGCSGSAETTTPVAVCAVGAAGTYTLFVYPSFIYALSAEAAVDWAASVADVADTSGCTAIAATSFGHAPTKGTLSSAQIGCQTLTVASQRTLRVALASTGGKAVTRFVDSAGTLNGCALTGRSDCTFAAGAYRLLTVSPTAASVTYRIWAADLNSTAGCAATGPDAVGDAPSNTGRITRQVITRCWKFTAPAGAQYLVRAIVGSGSIVPRVQLRRADGTVVCATTADVAVGCTVPAAGTYYFVVDELANVSPTGTGQVRLGFWRTDNLNCPTVGTSATDPPGERQHRRARDDRVPLVHRRHRHLGVAAFDVGERLADHARRTRRRRSARVRGDRGRVVLSQSRGAVPRPVLHGTDRDHHLRIAGTGAHRVRRLQQHPGARLGSGAEPPVRRW